MKRFLYTLTALWWALALLGFVGSLTFNIWNPGEYDHTPIEQKLIGSWFVVGLFPAVVLSVLIYAKYEDY